MVLDVPEHPFHDIISSRKIPRFLPEIDFSTSRIRFFWKCLHSKLEKAVSELKSKSNLSLGFSFMIQPSKPGEV